MNAILSSHLLPYVTFLMNWKYNIYSAWDNYWYMLVKQYWIQTHMCKNYILVYTKNIHTIISIEISILLNKGTNFILICHRIYSNVSFFKYNYSIAYYRDLEFSKEKLMIVLASLNNTFNRNGLIYTQC